MKKDEIKDDQKINPPKSQENSQGPVEPPGWRLLANIWLVSFIALSPSLRYFWAAQSYRAGWLGHVAQRWKTGAWCTSKGGRLVRSWSCLTFGRISIRAILKNLTPLNLDLETLLVGFSHQLSIDGYFHHFGSLIDILISLFNLILVGHSLYHCVGFQVLGKVYWKH